MDDLFGMMYNDVDPKKKLLTSVTCNMVDSLLKLLQDHPDLDINARLMETNGNTALHVACSSGHHACAKYILSAGGNPDIENDFGFSPLQLALRQGHTDCVRLVLKAGSPLGDPDLVWRSMQMDELPTWLSYDSRTLEYLLVATGDFNSLTENIRSQLFLQKLADVPRNLTLVRTYLLTGCRLEQADLSQLLANTDEAVKAAIKKCLATQPLQHYARIAIRRSLRPSVPYGATVLPLPPKLKDYLVFADGL